MTAAEIEEGWDGWGSLPTPPEPPCGCVVQTRRSPLVHSSPVCTGHCTTTTITLIGARGGAGTSTIAAMLALWARTMVPTELVTGDLDTMTALLGITPPADRPEPVLPGLRLAQTSTGDAELTVIDAGRQGDTQLGAVGPGERRIGVLRGPCYLALRTLLSGRCETLDGVVVVAEPGRALTERDVADVLGIPVVAVVPAIPAIARAIDAGLLTSRLAAQRELRPLRRWLTDHLDPFPPRRHPATSSAPPDPRMTGTDLLGAQGAPSPQEVPLPSRRPCCQRRP
jgi:hypothetical protein